MEGHTAEHWEAKRQVGRWLGKALVVIFAITGAVSLFSAIFKTAAFDKYPLPDFRLTTWQGDKEVAKGDGQIADERQLEMLGDYSDAVTLLLLSAGFYWLTKKKE